MIEGPYYGSSRAEEEKARAWAALPEGEKQRLIALDRAGRYTWGWCQRCRTKLQGIGSLPTTCPACGSGPEPAV